MIKITAKFLIDNQSKQEFLTCVKELELKSNLEKGCISYKLYQDVNDANMFTIFEEWEDEKAIDLHNNSEHFIRLIPKLHDMVKEIEVKLYKEAKYE